MPTSFENFVNTELPKRIATNESPTTPQAGDIPVFTGVGLLTESKTASEAGLATETFATNAANTAETNAKSYADDLITSIYKFQTTYNPQTTGNFPTTANTVGGVAIKKGFTWVVSGVTGQYTFQGVTVDNGDTLLALVDNASATSAADWHITEKNLGYTPENVSNKYSNNDLAGNAGTYPATPNVKAYVDTGLSGKQNTLADVITAGTYGSASKIPRATYNAEGIVTGITEVDLVAGITPVAYTNGTAYTVGQVVSFNNNLYRVVTAHTAGATPNGDIDLIGDVCKVFVGSSFTAYRLSNLANPAANKTLEVWGSGTSFTLDLVNAPSKVIFRTTNGYNVTALTISRAGSTFYYNRSGTSVGSNAVSLNVVGGCTLEISVYTSEVLVHVIQQPTIQGFKLVDTTTAGSTNVGVSFAGSIADVVYTLANKAINFGDLPNVATTDGNVLSGTRNRILGGSGNTVSGTDVVAIDCVNNSFAGNTGVIFNACYNSGNTVFPMLFPYGTVVNGTSQYPQIVLFDNQSFFGGAVSTTLGLCTSALSANGSTNNITTDTAAPSSTNSAKLTNPISATAYSAAVHDVDFVVMFGVNAPLEPSRTFYAKRRVYVANHYSTGFTSSVEVVGTDTNLGSVVGTVTIGFTIDTTNNRLVPTISATGSQEYQVSCRINSHYNRKT